MEKGHNVTFISPFGPDSTMSSPKIKDILPERLTEYMTKMLAENFDVNHRALGLVPPLSLVLDYFCYSACTAMYKSKTIQTWIQSKPHIDLIISDMKPDCSYGLVKKFNTKNILYVPLPMVTSHFESFGMNAETCSIPDYDTSRKTPLTFLNRVTNTLLPLWYRVLEIIFFQKYKTLFEEELGLTELPDVDDIRDLTSLMIINGDYLTDYPRSLPPFVIKVPGIHIKKPNEHLQLSKVK
jgi:hypothetical protein